MLALAELRRDIGRADERIEILAIGVRQAAQGIEQLGRTGIAGDFALECDELAQPGEAIAAEL